MEKHSVKEKAIVVSGVKAFKDLSIPDISRVYFGAETCPRLLPTQKDVDAVLVRCRKLQTAFTLVTPYCTDTIIKRIECILRILPKSTEVVFNDFGLLRSIQHCGLVPVLGRLLVSSIKDPRVLGRHGKHDFYYKANNLQRPLLQTLSNEGVYRVELDNIKQRYDIPLQKKIRFSLHYPFVCSSVTRRCLFASDQQVFTNFKPSTKCKMECKKGAFQVGVRDSKARLYIKENAQYYVNYDKSMLDRNDVDRLILWQSW